MPRLALHAYFNVMGITTCPGSAKDEPGWRVFDVTFVNTQLYHLFVDLILKNGVWLLNATAIVFLRYWEIFG